MMTSVQRCGEKKTYNSADEALEKLKVARMTSRSPGSLTAYRCNNCRRFHLGNHKALMSA